MCLRAAVSFLLAMLKNHCRTASVFGFRQLTRGASMLKNSVPASFAAPTRTPSPLEPTPTPQAEQTEMYTRPRPDTSGRCASRTAASEPDFSASAVKLPKSLTPLLALSHSSLPPSLAMELRSLLLQRSRKT